MCIFDTFIWVIFRLVNRMIGELLATDVFDSSDPCGSG